MMRRSTCGLIAGVLVAVIVAIIHLVYDPIELSTSEPLTSKQKAPNASFASTEAFISTDWAGLNPPALRTNTLPGDKQGRKQTDYRPDIQRLYQPAQRATELYVEPSFTFTGSRRLQLNLSLAGADQPLRPLLYSLYGLRQPLANWEDRAISGAALLLRGITDAQGLVYRQIEVPAGIKMLAIRVNVVGYENQMLLTLGPDQGEVVSVQLMQ